MNRRKALPVSILALASMANAQEVEPDSESGSTNAEPQEEKKASDFKQEYAPIIPM